MPSRSRKKRSEDKSRWAENRDDGLQRMKMHYESNKESILSSSRDKYPLNSDLFREKSGVRYADNPEPKKEASKRNYNRLKRQLQREHMTRILNPKRGFKESI